jgi:ABC-type spermidine/putrescine transport system permease subunit II
MFFSILLGVPAGYALARFAFRGATTYRLMILLTRAFPVAILPAADCELHPAGAVTPRLASV